MKNRLLEVIAGAVILALAVGYGAYMWLRVSPPSTQSGYTLNAEFLDVGGLARGADVVLNGIKVGSVSFVGLDEATYNAKVAVTVSAIKLPTDTTIAIVGDGLSGEKHVRLTVGRAKEFLGDGDSFTKVVDYESIEDKVSKIIFSTDG